MILNIGSPDESNGKDVLIKMLGSIDSMRCRWYPLIIEGKDVCQYCRDSTVG